MAEKPRLKDLFIKGIPARHVRLFGQADEPAQVDPFAEGLVTIDTVHSRIHQGIFYTANALDLTLADNASITFLIRTADNQGAHANPLGIAGGDAELTFFEAPTVTGAGTPLSTINKNRFSSNEAKTLVFLTPSLSADGLELDDHLIVGGVGPVQSVGGSGGFENEWILKTDTEYVLRITNRSGAPQPVHLQLDFYEP